MGTNEEGRECNGGGQGGLKREGRMLCNQIVWLLR